MIFWDDKPYGRIIISFIVGILIARYAPIYSNLIYIPLVISIATFYITTRIKSRYRETYAGAALLTMIMISGYVQYIRMDPRMQESHYQHELTEKNNFIHFEIQSIPKVTSRVNCIIDIIAIGNQKDSLKHVKGKMMAYFQMNDTVAAHYQPGQEVIAYGYVTALRKSKNPNAFDFNDYLKTKHVYYRVDIDSIAHKATGRDLSNPLEKIANVIRNHSLNAFQKYFHDPVHQSLLGAMVLGYRNTIDADMYESFTKTGAVHVLAVSGLHVGILCGLLLLLLNKVFKNSDRDKFIKISILIICCMIYVIITGASAAVLRASVMIIIYTIGKYWADRVSTYNVLSFSGFILLIYDPYMLFQASFQFSFLALLSIVFFFNRIYDLFYFENKWVNYIWQLIALSFAAQVLVSPLTIYYFHRFPTVFAISGIVAVPAAAVVLWGGMAIILIESCIPILNTAITYAMNLFLSVFIWSIRQIEKIPFSSFEDLWIFKHELALIYVFILLMMLGYAWKESKYITIALFSFLLFSISRFQNTRKTIHQSGIVAYDTFNGYLIDIYTGQNCYYLKSDAISDRSLAFITNNHRVSLGLENKIQLPLDTIIKAEAFAKNKNVIQLGESSIILIDSNYIETQNELETDIAIVIDSGKNKVEALTKKIRCNQWIITQNEKYYKQKIWEQHLSLNLNDHIILREYGAYSIEL